MTEIDLHQMYALAGIATPELKREVAEKVAESLNTLQRLKPDSKLPLPTISYELKGRTAGWANNEEIRLNLGMLYDPELHDDMLNQTVPHEVAHFVQFNFYPKSKPHGGQWEYLMYELGLRPDRCHQYHKLSSQDHTARNHKRPHVYKCPCGQIFHQTDLLHMRMQTKPNYTRICKSCKGDLRYQYTEQEV